MKTTASLLIGLLALLVSRDVHAQYYINQSELAEILGPCVADAPLDAPISYSNRVLYSRRHNSVLARATFYKILGDGDVDIGKKRSKLVGLINRKLVPMAAVGDTLVVPSAFVDDFCAYSPFPRTYSGAGNFDKLFIIDKTVQAWAAYAEGRLIRWGIVNTGAKESPTPNGRFNFNWKTEYRISSLSPPGEPWEMYWVFNFNEGRGIHIHQYPMPTGGPTSHGCVRIVEEDAKWIYNWADSWTLTKSKGFASGRGNVKEPGTTVLVIGNDPPADPQPFLESGSGPVLKMVVLPDHPFDVPPGTPQQKYFDQVRLATKR